MKLNKDGKTLMQSILDKQRRKFIEVSFEKMVALINKDPAIDRKAFVEQYDKDCNRSIVINIQGIEDMDTGFKWQQIGGDYQVARFMRATDKPTLIVHCDENTFIYITLQKITLMDAYLSSASPSSGTHVNYDGSFRQWSDGTKKYFIVEGEAPLRDIKLFDKMFKKYSHVFNKVWKKKHTDGKITEV